MAEAPTWFGSSRLCKRLDAETDPIGAARKSDSVVTLCLLLNAFTEVETDAFLREPGSEEMKSSDFWLT